jgi:predicted phosphodiesterase
MRIALFSDIHGHIAGLKAVLARLDRLGGADVTYALGDFVGGGPGGEEILDLLLDRQVRLVRGNWDEIFGNMDAYLRHTPPTGHAAILATYEWLCHYVSPPYQRLLTKLPMYETVDLPTHQQLLVCHATPNDTWARVCRADTPLDQLRAAYGQYDAQVIAYGHYHAHHVIQVDGQLLINVASVGLGWAGLSALTVLECQPTGLSVVQYQVPFDVAVHDRLIKERQMPPNPAIWYWE